MKSLAPFGGKGFLFEASAWATLFSNGIRLSAVATAAMLLHSIDLSLPWATCLHPG
jgi:hypothetical protein